MDVLLFGCGDYFIKKSKMINKLYNIVAVLDNFKQGNIQLADDRDVCIYSPQAGLAKYSDLSVVVAVQNFIPISKQLISLGVSPEKIIFSQNMEPYGSEEIIFNDKKKISLNNDGFYYRNDQISVRFENEAQFNSICQKEEQEYKKTIDKASYDEIDKMNLKIPKPISSELCGQNDFYGNAYWIKRYCGIPESYPIKSAIEHACYMGEDYVWSEDVNSMFDAIITLSPKRNEVLKKRTSKKIYMLGPYIAYADYSKSMKELEDEKERLGRTLVVFPSHSTDVVKMNFDFNLFIKEIKKLSKEFDTVRICVHYADILRNKHLAYKEAGFEIISAGHMFNTLFLPRLKSILYCCDMIMANDVGSYIGQAAYLNKPCYLYQQKLNVDETHNKEYVEEYLIRNKDRFYTDLFQKFSMPQDYISKEQRDMINYGWGNDLIKDKDGLKQVMGELEELWTNKKTISIIGKETK
jgi:hypothetical protein